MKKRMLEASFTVEAAFVVPIVIIVIMAVIYLSFYLRDNVTGTAIGYAYILENRGDVSNEELLKELKKNAFSMSYISSEIEETDNTVKISFESKTSIPFQAMKEYLGNGSNLNKSIEVSDLYKSDFIRMTKAAKDLLKEE